MTFSSPNWRSLNHLKGSLNHPKKVTLNHQECFFLSFFFLVGSFRRKIQPVTPRLVRFDSKVEKWLVELFTGIEAGWKIFVIPCLIVFCLFFLVGWLLAWFFSGVSKTFTDLLHKQKQELTSNINVTCGDYLFKTPLTPPQKKICSLMQFCWRVVFCVRFLSLISSSLWIEST